MCESGGSFLFLDAELVRDRQKNVCVATQQQMHDFVYIFLYFVCVFVCVARGGMLALSLCLSS